VDGSHKRRGYDESALGHNTAYHYFIGGDGTLVQTRPETDRTLHTSNCDYALSSIGIVLAGDFNNEMPTDAQLKTLKALVTELQKKYNVPPLNIVGHGETKATGCPGKNLEAVLVHYRSLL
jgi:N-acetyl-anhydromuramyl-L-alanine amidase AmpD